MKIGKVRAVFFSPTGNTKFIVEKIAGNIARRQGVPWESYDFTLPGDREKAICFAGDELAVAGLPVYAGRIPNKMLPFVQSNLEGNGALAVPVVTFGNRSYDNALIELRNILENRGFHTVAGAAFVSAHAFSGRLAAGRPDGEDIHVMEQFARGIADKVSGLKEIPAQIAVRGTAPLGAYYTPLGTDGKPAVFLKAKPKTRESCTDCKLCTRVCPMGSISYEHPDEVPGVCIKCQACVARCPEHAKYFDDPAFLSHVAMLEQRFVRKAGNEVFL